MAVEVHVLNSCIELGATIKILSCSFIKQRIFLCWLMSSLH